MLPIIPLAIAGCLVGAVWHKRRGKHSLVRAMNCEKTGKVPQAEPKSRSVISDVTTSIAKADAKYQRFIQTHIDPFFGKTRYAQLQEILSEDALTLNPEERAANQRIGVSALALLGTILGYFFFAPLISLANLIGFSTTWQIYHSAYIAWKKSRQVTVLHLISIYVTVLWLSGYATIGILSLLLHSIGLKFKAITEAKSRNNLINIFKLQPQTVWVRINNIEMEIPFSNLQVGDILVLHAGQTVPADGIIVTGVATVNQQMLTGEAQPVEKSKGDLVLAATIIVSGKIDTRVEKTGVDTTAGQIGDILNQIAQQSTTTQLTIINKIDRLVMPTLALSTISMPFLGFMRAVTLMGSNFTINSYITEPVGTLNFLNIAANNHILIKDAGALEQLNKVDTIVFDKTGTLTLEQPQVVQIHTFNGMSVEEVLRLAAGVEARQTHPISRAILAAAADLNLSLPAIAQAHYEVGYGLKVQLMPEDRETKKQDSLQLIRVGSSRFMLMEGIALSTQVQALTDLCQNDGHSLIMVAIDDKLVGCIELQPTIRPEAQQIIRGLRKRGLALYIISGDQEASTQKLAQDLGMTGYYANALPETKADLIEQLQKEGHCVCFIGDGINDAIAMRKAQVSISLRGATTVATDTAQIILMEGNLNQNLYLFQLAERYEHILKHNFRFTFSTSLASMTGVLLFGFTFAANEALFIFSLLGSFGIAMKPLLDQQKTKVNNKPSTKCCTIDNKE